MKFIQYLNGHSRKIAIAFCAIISLELLNPMLAVALTAGPTAPEATSFEPVDTTDMVNPLIGSFTYNLPLLDVPGPEGGYPLSLSYHAGIRPDLEASWVGLGWTLNPGAINRNVAGLPDDFSEVNLKRRDYWVGGNRKEYGLEVGFASIVNVGLVYGSDTYMGFGLGMSVGFGYRYGTLRGGIDVGVSPFGEGYATLGVSSGFMVSNGMGIGVGVSVSTNFENVYAGAGISLITTNGWGSQPTNLLSASMTTISSKPSLSLLGVSAPVFNKNANRISSNSSGFGFSVPIGFFSIGVSFRNTRYWSDETAEVGSSGTLYTPILPANTATAYMDDRTYDNYRLMPDNLNIADNPEDHEMLGGTFPEYDNYVVTGQGIGGQIRPFLYQRALALQNTGYDKSFFYSSALSNVYKAGVGFRFVNDFSNAFDQNLDNVVSQSGAPQDTKTLPFSMSGIADRRVGNELPGSRHIKYFTNDEIRNGSAKAAGFIDVGNTAKGFDRITNNSVVGGVRATKGGSQIGGFMVTNQSGVTYHYALPVYTYNEYSFNYTHNGGYRYTETNRKEPYAYTWLLTAVTGPDYVDRNGNGVVDESDWGYWVAMDYGKWTNNYVWRTPAEGTDKDLDQYYSMYTSGQKQLYYLNRIRTRTHTAIFEKEVRLDGKGSSQSSLSSRNINGAFDETSAQSLKLNRIYLINNADIDIVGENSEQVSFGRSGDLYNNVIDSYDILKIGRSNMEAKSIRIIDFGHSYSLCKKTPNSFNIRQPAVKLGKLTLDGIEFRGKGGEHLLPVTSFSYDDPSPGFKGNVLPGGRFTSTTSLEVGTMIETVGNNPVYLGMITKVEQGSLYTYTLSNGENMGSVNNIDLRVTKNPNYGRDNRDVWGFYKGDLDRTLLNLNEDFARRVTVASSKGVDAWNLRKISSPTGNAIELNYESNEFQTAVFEKNLSVPIQDIQRVNSSTFRVSVPATKGEFEQQYSPGSVLNAVFYGSISAVLPTTIIHSDDSNPRCVYQGWHQDNWLTIRFNTDVHVLEVGNIRLGLNNRINYGGGPRLKSIVNRGIDNVAYQTEYSYRVNSTSTGTTSYIPYNMEVGNITALNTEAKRNIYKKILNRDLDNVLKYAREIPGPGVMYSKVQIRNKVVQPNGDTRVEGFTENQYRVLDRRMINRVVLQNQDFGSVQVNAVNLSITDFTTNIGDLIGIKYFDADGKLIKELQNKYLIDDISPNGNIKAEYRNQLARFNNQGLIVERFGEVRAHYRRNNPAKTNIVMAAREQYPSIILSSTVKDYINGFSETRTNMGFDFLNGQPNKIMTMDSYGNRFLSETDHAYNKYPQMGSKLSNLSNKNMLSQIHSQMNYKLDNSNNKIGVVSGTRTIWSKEGNVRTPEGTVIKQNSNINGHIWRIQKTEVLEIPSQFGGGGILPISHATDGLWKPVSTFNLYDVYSKGLEVYDRRNNYSANRHGYRNSRITAEAAFSNYWELAFSGAEDELIGLNISGEVSKGVGTVSSSTFHTGSKSLSVPAGGKGFEYVVPLASLTRGRTYVASVWVRNSSNTNVNLYYEIDGTVRSSPANSANSTKKSGDWTLVTLEIPVNTGTNLRVYVKNDGGAVSFVDDFRFHPKNSSATAYVYDDFTGDLTYILDHLNLYTKFEYDGMGRLIRTYKEQLGRAPYKTNEYRQNYGANTAKAVYVNDMLRESIRKNNCTSGTGSFVEYTVPQGKYSSTISKADANSKAMAEMNSLGQQYANQNGACIVCRRYKITIPVQELEGRDLYVNFVNCNNAFRSLPLGALETEPIAPGSQAAVFFACVSVNNTAITFSNGPNQPSMYVSANIELVGDCY